MEKTKQKGHHGLWILIVAAMVLEAISCIQYFTSRAGIRAEAEQRAKSELRRAELEINVVTVEVEAATKMLVTMAERYIDRPDSIAAATRVLLQTMDKIGSAGVACKAYLFPEEGQWYEVCSSRDTCNGQPCIYTREIGSAEHDYFQMDWYKNGFVHDSCWWSEPYLDDSGARTMIVSCTHPIRNRQGEIVAVACVDLSLDYLQRISEYLQIYKDSYYSIRSNKGLDIVSGADTVPGRKYQIYDEEIDATGWKISIIIPEDVIFAELNRIGELIGLLMLIGLGLLIFIVWRSGRDTMRLIDSTARNQKMENELHIASAIQMAMLPKVFPPFSDRLDLNIYGSVDPAKEVGGDLYDFYVRHDKLFFCIGDVSGKGVPASLVMSMTRSLFRGITSHEERAAEIVRQMNDGLAEQNDSEMFVTLILGVLDLTTGQLDYCNAGHNPPVLMAGGRWQTVDVLPNLPLGIMAGFDYKQQSLQMNADDLLFLYTDGLSEAENSEHAQFGEQRIMNNLATVSDTRPRAIIDMMQSSVNAFVDGAEQSDDLTMLVVRYQQKALLMRNDIQQIPTLAEWVEGLGIPDELSMPVNLALEETVSNVMLYAYPETNSGRVFVEFNRHQSAIIFTITDSGIPFDPTKQKPADTTLSAEDRAIGGLGIHLVRQLMDEVIYCREDDKNVLTLIKRI